MKCKIQRQEAKSKQRRRRKFFKELTELNPKYDFFLEDEGIIKVNTLELWRLNWPESCSSVNPEESINKKNVERYGCVVLVQEDEEYKILGW